MGSGHNILVLFPDQLRRSALGCYGDANAATPNIDKLARQSTCFDRAYASFPVCVPFRFSLFSGEPAHEYNVPCLNYRMPPQLNRLPHRIKDAGYHTCYIGKWHLYGQAGGAYGPWAEGALRPIPKRFRAGWDRWLGFESCNQFFNTFYFEDDDPTPKPLNKFQTDGCFDLAIREIENSAKSDRPWFTIVSVTPPHFPFTPKEEDAARWKNRELNLPPNFLEPADYPLEASGALDREDQLDKARKYYAMIENFDANVGRILDTLEATGQREKTIIVLFSDHGEWLGSSGKSAGEKGDPHEVSAGIPLIIHHPDWPGGRVSSAVGGTEDLHATLLALAGAEAFPDCPGRSWIGQDGTLPDILHPEGVLLEYTFNPFDDPWSTYNRRFWRAIVEDRYKYGLYGGGEEGAQPWILFDLENDPHEEHNLVNDPENVDLASHLHRKLIELIRSKGDHFCVAPAFGQPGLNYWQEHRHLVSPSEQNA